jgi:hypothetical protein
MHKRETCMLSVVFEPTIPSSERRQTQALNYGPWDRRMNIYDYYVYYGPGSVVDIATGYRLDGPGIESQWVEIFRTCPVRPWGPSSLLYNGYRVFPGGKERPGREAHPSPTSSAVVKEG